MCYKSVQWIIVAQPSERSNKTKCPTSIHELLSRTSQHVTLLIEFNEYDTRERTRCFHALKRSRKRLEHSKQLTTSYDSEQKVAITFLCFEANPLHSCG
jgi:hypothetical protein